MYTASPYAYRLLLTDLSSTPTEASSARFISHHDPRLSLELSHGSPSRGTADSSGAAHPPRRVRGECEGGSSSPRGEEAGESHL